VSLRWEKVTIKPKPNFKAPPKVILAFTRPDCQLIKKALGLEKKATFFLTEFWQKNNMALCGPVLGAPQAAIALEYLKAAGAEEILAFGWAGALQKDISLGSLILPDFSFSEEGTSRHYGYFPQPTKELYWWLYHELTLQGFSFTEGKVVSTDALFRETEEFLARYAEKAQAIDMETSAIFSVAEALGLKIGSLLLISDRVFPSYERLSQEELRHKTETLMPVFRSFYG